MSCYVVHVSLFFRLCMYKLRNNTTFPRVSWDWSSRQSVNQLVRSWSLPHELLTGVASSTLYSLAMTCFYEIVYNRNKKNKKAIDSHLLLNIHFSYTPWDKNRNWEYCTWNFECCVYRLQSVHRRVWKDNNCNNNNYLLVIYIYIYNNR